MSPPRPTARPALTLVLATGFTTGLATGFVTGCAGEAVVGVTPDATVATADVPRWSVPGADDGCDVPDATAVTDGASTTDVPGGMDVSAPTGPTVSLGTGLDHWVEVPSGARVPLIHGSQGLWMLYGRVRFHGFQSDVRVSYRVTPLAGGTALDPADIMGARHSLGHGIAADSNGFESDVPDQVILTAIQGPPDVNGMMFRWQVFVTEVATMNTITAVRTITIGYDADGG